MALRPSMGPNGFANILKKAELSRTDSHSSLSSSTSGVAEALSLQQSTTESNVFTISNLLKYYLFKFKIGGTGVFSPKALNLPNIGQVNRIQSIPSGKSSGMGTVEEKEFNIEKIFSSDKTTEQKDSTWEAFDEFIAIGSATDNNKPMVAALVSQDDPNFLFNNAISCFEAEDWTKAEEWLNKVMMKQNTTISNIKEYMIVVILMKNRLNLSAMQSAVYCRYAASVALNENHKIQISKISVKENMNMENYGYCHQLLMWLIEKANNDIFGEFDSSLQEQLNVCEKNNKVNANIANDDEDYTTFGYYINSASNAAELNDVVRRIVI